MNPDLLLPIIASVAWLLLAGIGFASYQLRWSQMAKMALAWLVIFGGLYVIVEWFMVTQNAASAVL